MHELSATELLVRYRERSLSPVEVTQAVIARIERWEPRLHALYHFDPEAALVQARASEQRWQRGEALALDGVPLTLKENIATAGCPMPLGTAALADAAPATEDAPPAARLREAGAVLLGKTTMPDYGMLSSGVSSLHPTTGNPWDTRLNPGGSSAGAAAAAAAGYGPLHLGTDIGGSVRLPASWCGIFTLKPSLGRIPIQPPYAGRVAGPMTRTVADAALMMGPLSQPDWRDGMSLPADPMAWQAPPLQVRGLRLGLLMDAGWGLDVDPEVAAAIEAAARTLEQAGAIVEPVAPFSSRAMIDGLDRFWRMRSWLDMQALTPERRERVLPYIRAWVATAERTTAAELFQGYSQMAAFRDAALRACQPFDFLLSPVAPCVAFEAERASPLDDPARPFEHIAFTVPFNFSEQPAASIPCGTNRAGLPIGLQIVGRRHDDLGVLRLAAAFEPLREPMPPWPAP
ncbi:amidase [Pelomonas sp. SE-A7]|uniref:amidase n=1 Tax=Pelomonas sp. SE-A7 TaxID=3054953 RepID=UPI00259C7D6B|nr:amidase [Pelomonas sp. SE-A7]MDM4768185.1 amidase [Pelomonas sp. SE-A7]